MASTDPNIHEENTPNAVDGEGLTYHDRIFRLKEGWWPDAATLLPYQPNLLIDALEFPIIFSGTGASEVALDNFELIREFRPAFRSFDRLLFVDHRVCSGACYGDPEKEGFHGNPIRRHNSTHA